MAQKVTLPGISNAGKVSDSLFRGAQPHLSSLDELKKLGITAIVDLRSESHHTRERERLKAESLGIRFISIPVDGFSTPTSAQLAEFFTLFREAPLQKVFVHCEFGQDRTGVFIAAYRIAFDHWSSDQALSEMLYFGFNRRWHRSMASFVRSLPDRLHSDAILKSALQR
jgi:tyrosine-protein phosphatase SIW14